MPSFDLIKEFDELNIMSNAESQKIELLDYCGDMQTLVLKKIGVQFRNSGNFHAAIVMSNIFLNSKESIKIFAGCFDGKVSGISIWSKSLQFAFENKPDLNIEVILEERPALTSIGFNIIKKLQSINKERVSVSLLNSESNFIKKKKFHFTVGDENMYRFETDTKEFQAVCNFDDEITSKKLIDYFDIMKLGVSAI